MCYRSGEVKIDRAGTEVLYVSTYHFTSARSVPVDTVIGYLNVSVLDLRFRPPSRFLMNQIFYRSMLLDP